MPDAATSALSRQVLRRAHIVRQRTRLKNQVHAILHRNLVPRCPAADLFGIKGRHWLAQQDLPPDKQDAARAVLESGLLGGEVAAGLNRAAEPGVERFDRVGRSRARLLMRSTPPARMLRLSR